MPYKNKEDLNANKRAYREKNKDKVKIWEKKTRNRRNKLPEVKEGHTVRQRKAWRARKEQAVEYLGGRCSVCGVKDDACVYDFHHVDPSKKYKNITALMKRKWETIKTELEKCILVCSNCHRKIHRKHMENETANEVEVQPEPTFVLSLDPLKATASEVAFVLNLLGIQLNLTQYSQLPASGRKYFVER